jgi:hypothetical protein
MDRESLFRAEVIYITKEEWSEELRKLFEDIHDSGVEGDNEDDSERYVSPNNTSYFGFIASLFTPQMYWKYMARETLSQLRILSF